jgi:glycosyltransferase involved in cell wall biosynthesis
MKYRLVMVISRFPPAIGGTEIQCRELSETLNQRGQQVQVVTERYDPQLPGNETINGVQVIRLSSRGARPLASFLFSLRLFIWLIKNKDFDIVHAHMLAGPAIAALLAGKLLGKPVIVKIAGAGPTGDLGTSKTRRRGQFKLWLFKQFACFVTCPSPITFRELQSLGVSGNYLRLVPNGVNTTRFKPADQQKPMRDPLAIFAGRWTEGKGVEQLLAVWEAAQKRPEFRWSLQLLLHESSNGPRQARLDALRSRVHWQAGIKDPRPFYQEADLAILLSENEGLSNFLLEAMASGLPLMTSPAAAVGPENESDGWSWRVDPQDTAGILELLIRLQDDPAALRGRGDNARRRVLEAFSSDRVAPAF